MHPQVSSAAADDISNAAGFQQHDGREYPASAQKGRLGSSKQADVPPSAMHAASVVKPQKRGGVTWADSPSPAVHSAADRSPAAVL